MILISTIFRRAVIPATRRAAVLAAALLLALGCEAEPDPAPASLPPIESEPVAYDLLGAGANALVRDTTELVIRDAATWEAYRDSLRPLAPFREVDFETVDVLLLAVPQQTSGYSVDLVNVETTPELLDVAYQINRPGIDCLTATAVAAPFVAAIIPKTDKPVRFDAVIEDYSCTGSRRF